MANIKELFLDATLLNFQIKELLQKSGVGFYDELCAELNKTNPNDCQMYYELNRMLHNLSEMSNRLDYLNKPVEGEYVLHKGSNGRFSCEVFEFTCGCLIEALVYDDYYESYAWVLTSVEADDGGYYLVGYKDISLEGLKIRIRK